MITKSRLNLFVWLQKSWGSSQWGSCPGCLASKRCKTSGRSRGSFSFYVRGNWWSSKPDGKSAMLIAISRMDPVCLSWGQVWCCLFWCQALRGELLGGVWECGIRRKEGLLFGAVCYWMFCGNQHVNILRTMQKWEGFKYVQQSWSGRVVMWSFSAKIFISF